MDLIKILNSIDFIDGRVDINSVHPTRLNLLVEVGYVDQIDPGDGEPCFYIVSIKGAESWATQTLFDELGSSKLEKMFIESFMFGKTIYYNFNKN